MEYYQVSVSAKKGTASHSLEFLIAILSSQTLSRQVKERVEGLGYEYIKALDVQKLSREQFLNQGNHGQVNTMEYYLVRAVTNLGPGNFPVCVNPNIRQNTLQKVVKLEAINRAVTIDKWYAEPITEDQYNELAGIQVEDERPELPPIKAILNLYANQYHWNPETQIQLLLGFIEEYPTTEYTRNDFVNYLNIEVSIQWKNVDGPNYPMTPNEYKETPIITD